MNSDFFARQRGVAPRQFATASVRQDPSPNGRNVAGGIAPTSEPVAAPMPEFVVKPSGGLTSQTLLRSKHTTRLTKKRLIAAGSYLTSIMAVFFLVTGVTSARFSATPPTETNHFTAGTVTLSNSAIANCPVSNLFPTGTAATPCTFTATYSGSVPAYLATNVVIETQSGSGGTKLYNPTDSANDLQVTITSTTPSVTYTVPTTATTCPGGAPVGSTCYELDNELISTSAQSSASVGFGVTFKLPTSSTTGYQGGAAQVTLTTHAVQSGNNTLSCTTTATAGSPCTPNGSFKWS